MAYYYTVTGPEDYTNKPTDEVSMREVSYLFAKRLCEIDDIKDAKSANEAICAFTKKDKYFDDIKHGDFKNPVPLKKYNTTIYFNMDKWYMKGTNKNFDTIETKLMNLNKYIIIKKTGSSSTTNNIPNTPPQGPSPKRNNLQLILYGAPGTGKSFEINKDLEGQIIYRTTFHPDTDYATFVGCYKPDMDNNNNIIYSFIPQIFIKAYLRAWEEYINTTQTPLQQRSEKGLDITNKDDVGQKFKHVYLVIEEINRGGCAQIFGDIFQLLDRDDEGWSQYVIIPDQDIIKFLKSQEAKTNYNFDLKGYEDKIRERYSDIINNNSNKGELYLSLPPNFHIWATMNTSDQSLFPMDSAFKRRWDWEYLPINPEHEKVKGLKILVNNQEYDYPGFLNKINSLIKSILKSADKQIGEFFVKSKDGKPISFEDFRDKILFYLFNDVFKDNKSFREDFYPETELSLFEDLSSMDNKKQEEIVSKWLSDKLEVNSI